MSDGDRNTRATIDLREKRGSDIPKFFDGIPKTRIFSSPQELVAGMSNATENNEYDSDADIPNQLSDPQVIGRVHPKGEFPRR